MEQLWNLLVKLYELAKAQPVEARKLFLRVWAALNDGIGAYIVAMALLALACLFARVAFEKAQPSRDAQEALKKLLITQQEPFRPESRPSLSGAILNGGEAWDICDDGNSDTRQLLDEAYTFFKKRYLDAGVKLDAKAYPHLNKILQSDVWNKGIFRNPVLRECSGQSTPNCPVEPSATLPPAMTDDSVLSTLRIPSGVARGRSNETLRSWAKGSLQMESLVGLTNKAFTGKAEPELPEIKLLYFVSVEGLFRFVPAEPLHSPAYRVFNATSYFYSTIAGEQSACADPGGRYSRHQSLPYLDLLGHGAVVTVCYRVASNANIVEGAFCADVAIPRKQVLDRLAGGVLFDTYIARLKIPVEVSGRATGKARAGSDKLTSERQPDVYLCGDKGFQCPERLAPTSEDDRQMVHDAAVKCIDQIINKNTESGGAEVKVVSESRGIYAATIWRYPSSQDFSASYDVAVLRLRSPPYRGWPYLFLACLCFAAVACLIVVSRAFQDRRRDATLARGFQVGVLRLDNGDYIIGANDRAEEILGRHLPRLGIASPATRLMYMGERCHFPGCIVDGLIVVRTADGYDARAYEQEQERRKRGVVSEYWTRITTPRTEDYRWVRVIGSPIFKVDGTIETFGVIEPIDSNMLRPLESSILWKRSG